MMKFQLLLLPLQALLLVSTVRADSGLPNYRIQSTTYAVTIQTSMESKNTNCQNTFGEGSIMADFADLKRDFGGGSSSSAVLLEEFNEALTGVFFKSPTASFFVSLNGMDSPPDAPDAKTTHYVLRNGATSSTKEVLDKLGNANLETSKKQHQVLCAVPVKGGENSGVSGGGDTSASSTTAKTPKPYKSPDDKLNTSDSDGSSGKTSWMTKILVAIALVGIALTIRNYKSRSDSYNFPPRNSGGSNSSRAYYSVLDPQKPMNLLDGSDDDGGAFLAPGDMSASLCAGAGANETELSGYGNPTATHDLRLSQSLPLPQQQPPV